MIESGPQFNQRDFKRQYPNQYCLSQQCLPEKDWIIEQQVKMGIDHLLIRWDDRCARNSTLIVLVAAHSDIAPFTPSCSP
jgi:hypothetical protein